MDGALDTAVYRDRSSGDRAKIAEGFELEEQLTATVVGATITRSERRLVIRSLQYAASRHDDLAQSAGAGRECLLTLNQPKQGRTPLTTVAAMQEAAEALLQRYDVMGLLTLTYTETVQERQVRKYGDRPAETRIACTVAVTVVRNPAAPRWLSVAWGGV